MGRTVVFLYVDAIILRLAISKDAHSCSASLNKLVFKGARIHIRWGLVAPYGVYFWKCGDVMISNGWAPIGERRSFVRGANFQKGNLARLAKCGNQSIMGEWSFWRPVGGIPRNRPVGGGSPKRPGFRTAEYVALLSPLRPRKTRVAEKHYPK